MIEFEFTALFKISLEQTYRYPNQERIQKILVGGCSFDMFECKLITKTFGSEKGRLGYLKLMFSCQERN